MPTPPDESFVPLTTRTFAANDRPNYRVTVLSGAATRPLSDLQSNNTPVTGAPRSANDPAITLHREGDHVSAIGVRCACGRTIELACVYEDFPTPESKSPAV